MGLFKSNNQFVTRWTAGFELFENSPVAVEARFLETEKAFYLQPDYSPNYREFCRLAGGQIVFKKNNLAATACLYETEQAAVDAFYLRQLQATFTAKKRLELEEMILADLVNNLSNNRWRSITCQQ
jgi:hypothetical protein